MSPFREYWLLMQTISPAPVSLANTKMALFIVIKHAL